ncbi:HNH endonuclease [Chitinophaga jiangningensis]|uniref:HNH endonuclease n=1 Tax=Chitinophaga jiangningensis TaxID=1419482 RepID=A0A1M7KHA8_9BACT|nr:HNH endonuclease domain-containing protein [Chitinophaga jiangningensis]SHM64749.1 HNH endonuclease [Chitinophaga jiangningensis]
MPLTAEDRLVIQAAIELGGNIWENDLLKDIKRKIKDHCLTTTSYQCCYCRTDFTDEFRMVMDIEHILPKSIFSDFMFDVFNLSVSCKRCNMRIKKERTDFLQDINQVRLSPIDPDQYLISHPNLEDYFQHCEYFSSTHNGKKYIKYVPLTDKGVFTYTYFELERKEIECLSENQGVRIAENEISENIPIDLTNEIRQLLNR